jgi:hypothetical protein
MHWRGQVKKRSWQQKGQYGGTGSSPFIHSTEGNGVRKVSREVVPRSYGRHDAPSDNVPTLTDASLVRFLAHARLDYATFNFSISQISQ